MQKLFGTSKKRWKVLEGVLGIYVTLLYTHLNGKKTEVQFQFNKDGNTVVIRSPCKE